MKILTITELLHLSRTQLLGLLQAVQRELAALPEGSADHAAALANLDTIRAALARPKFRIRRPGPPAPHP